MHTMLIHDGDFQRISINWLKLPTIGIRTSASILIVGV